MSEPVKIVIVLEGGNITDVITAGVPVQYMTVDYDCEGCDADQLVAVPQDDGTTQAALVYGPHDATGESWQPWALAAFDDKFGYNKPYSVEALKLFDTDDFDEDETLAALQAHGWTDRRAKAILDEHIERHHNGGYTIAEEQRAELTERVEWPIPPGGGINAALAPGGE